MKKKTITSMILTGIVAVVLSAPALAGDMMGKDVNFSNDSLLMARYDGDYGKKGKKHHKKKHKAFIKKLDLTDDQVKQFKAIKDDARSKSKVKHEEMKTLKTSLRELSFSDNPDEARLRQLTSDIGKLQGELIQHRVETMVRLRAILTPEQREKFDRKKKERHKKRKMRGKDRKDS